MQVWKISEPKSIRTAKYLLQYPVILVHDRHFPGLSRHFWSEVEYFHLVAAAWYNISEWEKKHYVALLNTKQLYDKHIYMNAALADLIC